MPTNMVAHQDLATALAAYRILLAVQLALHCSTKPTSSEGSTRGISTTNSNNSRSASPAPGAAAAAAEGSGSGGGLKGTLAAPAGRGPTIAAAAAAVAAAHDARRQLSSVGDVVMGDPVLAAAGQLLQDEVLCWALTSRWQSWCKEALHVPVGVLGGVQKRCVLSTAAAIVRGMRQACISGNDIRPPSGKVGTADNPVTGSSMPLAILLLRLSPASKMQWCTSPLALTESVPPLQSCLSTCGDVSAVPVPPSLDAILGAFKRCVLEVRQAAGDQGRD
jgi:hypothetical protein